jgi:hypothetical protein
MVLEVAGYPAQQMELEGWYYCPYEITRCTGPADAPFENAWTEALLGGLSRLWGPEILVQALNTGTPWEREVAAEQLAAFGTHEGVVAALATALGDGPTDVREKAAESLVDIGPDAIAAQSALIDALGDASPFVRAPAAEALGLLGEDAMAAVPALIAALDDASPGPREAAAIALRRITGEWLGKDAVAWQEWWEGRE